MKCQDFKGSQDSSAATHDIISAAQRSKEWLASPQLVLSTSPTELLQTLTETSKSTCANSNLDFFLQGHVSCTALSPSDATPIQMQKPEASTT